MDLLCFVIFNIFAVTNGLITSVLQKRTYLYHSKPLNWTEANSICSNAGGMLAKISDVSTLPDIQDHINILKHTPSFWIGLSLDNDIWKWQDNSELQWSSWKAENLSHNENCVSASYDTEYVWERTECDSALPFLCEFPRGSCKFRRYNRTSIVGHNIFTKTAISLEECRKVCVEAVEVTCLSFEYNAYGHFCQLSNTNRWINPEKYVYYDASWDYFHRTCIRARLWSDDDELFRLTTGVRTDSPSTTELTLTTDSITKGSLKPRQYALYNETVSWYDAESSCEKKGGILATIYDKSTLPEAGHKTNKKVWIGLSRKSDKIWRWINDTVPVTWSNWRYQPSPFDFSHCASVQLNDNYWWYPTICSEKLQFLCQFQAASCEYSVTRNASLLANNDIVLMNTTVEECKDACDASTKFICRSFEYNHNLKECHLSQNSRWTLPDFYHENIIHWEYYHRRCNFDVDGKIPKETTTSVEITTYPQTKDITTEFTEIITTTHDFKTTQHIQTFEELQEELESFGADIKKKRLEESKTSIYDDRPSATSVGVVAIVILASIFGGVFLLDLGTIGAHCKYMKNPNRKKRKIKKVHCEDHFTNIMEVCKTADDIGVNNSDDYDDKSTSNSGTTKSKKESKTNGYAENVYTGHDLSKTREKEITESDIHSSNIAEDETDRSKESTCNSEKNDKKGVAEVDLEIDVKNSSDIESNACANNICDDSHYENKIGDSETKVNLEMDDRHYVSIIDIKMNPKINQNELVTYM